MKLWTIQPPEILDEIKASGVYRCNPDRAELLTDPASRPIFRQSYDWLAGQMKRRLGPPPDGVRYPVWAWYRFDGENRKPDLRRTEFRTYGPGTLCIGIEIPDDRVLLSDELKWHFVLNNWWCDDSTSEEEHDRITAEIEQKNYGRAQYQRMMRKSWENIFNIEKVKNDWCTNGYYVQATFWELPGSSIRSIQRFGWKAR